MRFYGSKTWVGSEIGSQEKYKQQRAALQENIYGIISYACKITYVNMYVQVCIECLRYNVSNGYLWLVEFEVVFLLYTD